MIDVYSWATPNGHKVHIMLEECGQREGRDWRAIPINIGTGDQFNADFLRISPNNKIPAMVDPQGPGGKPLQLFESGAMLV
ncbi:MAG: glutathione S-transferase family protein, partial [Burkholderiaceae bacterium]